jgi:hypothetical protein
MSYYGEQEDVGCVANKPEEGVGRLKYNCMITKKKPLIVVAIYKK